MHRHHCLAVCLLLLSACGDSGDDTNTNANQNSSACLEGFEQSGPACNPIFDDCPGPAEISVLGGGCQQVGVTTCATGLFESDGEGGCEPILPDHTCPPGTMELLGQTECQPVGVTECAAGFESDGEGGCDAILPPGPDPCPSGTITLLGHTTCQPLGDCGTGTWGNIVDDSTTVYVDASNVGGGDGTQGNPYPTIGEAVLAVSDGGQIAIGGGTYQENVLLDRPVRLVGRCAAEVTIQGIGDSEPAVLFTDGASDPGTSIRGVTLTGEATGLQIDGAQGVSVENVQVVDTAGMGIVLQGGALVSVRRVVVARSTKRGVYSYGSNLEIEESEVRDTHPTANGTYGRGVQGQCDPAGACGSLLVSSSLVTGNRDQGIFALGVGAEITATAVLDTLPEQSSRMWGRGIGVQCDSVTGACGSLTLSSSLVSGSRDSGIFVLGVDVEITATVVRDTLPQESTGASGFGILALCNAVVGVCGGLLVSSSVVSGNRQYGIHSSGLDAEVTSTVVRDTLSEQSTGWFGRGINVECDSALGCGSLLVSSCLFSGNREHGIQATGVDAEITTTVVRDTLPEQGTGLFGWGISAQCSSTEACGRLLVSSSLVTGNHDLGIIVFGADADVIATVVRDTMPEESSGTSGRGISAQCHSETGVCGSLLVSSSLVTGNRDVGIRVSGANAEVTATVVRDTLPMESDGTSGRGISGQCHSETGVCGSLLVSSSLVTDNREAGIYASGVDAEVTTTVVRDTLPKENDGTGGRGINAQCDPVGLACGSLRMSSCLVSGNHELGIYVSGLDTEVTATVVRDTLPGVGRGGGRGINAECSSAGDCESLRVSSSLIMSNENVGLFIYGTSATLEGVAIIDTRPNVQGPWDGIHGQGIWGLCDPDLGACGSLSMASCLVDSSQGGGVAMEGISGFMASSVVRTVVSQSLDGKYGYGVQIGGLEGEEMPTFNINDCEIRDAKLAGILYYRARGTLSGSVVAGGENSVVMNEGSEPTILDNNDLSGTVENDPTWANLYPSPAPPPALPSSSDPE